MTIVENYEDWIEFFNLKGNPFSTTPLNDDDEFETIFIETNDIRKKVLPIIKYISNSKPSIKILAGKRGAGKSTCLAFTRRKLQSKPNILTIQIKEQKTGQEKQDPLFGIGSPLVWNIIKELIEALQYKYPQVSSKYETEINRIVEFLKLDEFLPKRYPGWYECRNSLERLLKIIKSEKILLFITIDNFDKLTDELQELSISFLRGNNAQPLFENLQAHGATIIFTMDLRFYQNLKDPDFSYLGEPIILTELNTEEGKELLQRRLKNYFATDNSSLESIIESNAFTYLVTKANGIPREVIKLTESCCEKAFEEKAKPITSDIIDQVIQKREEMTEEFYTILERKPSLQDSFQKLTTFLGSFAKLEEAKNAIKVVNQLYDNKEVNYSDPLVDVLREFKIAEFIKGTDSDPKLTLYVDIKLLLGEMENRKVRMKFSDWVVKRGSYNKELLSPKNQDLLPAIMDIIQELENEDVKGKLTDAKLSLEEANLHLKDEDVDTDNIIKYIFGSIKNISEGAFIISKNEMPKKITIDELESFLRISIPTFLYTFQIIKVAEENKQVAKLTRSQLMTIIDQFYTNVPLLLQYIQGKKDELERNKQKPKELHLTKEALARKLFILLRESKIVLIREGNTDFEDFGLCLWLNEKKVINGFAFGKKLQAKASILSIYKFPVGRNLIIPSEIKKFLDTKQVTELLKENPLQNKKNYLELNIIQTFELVSLLFNHQTEYKPVNMTLLPLGSGLEVKILYELEKTSDYAGTLKLYPSKKEYVDEAATIKSVSSIISSRRGLSKPQLDLIVIDGNNIAYIEKNKPKAEKIIKLYDSLKVKYKKTKVKIFISAKFEHDAPDYLYLTKLLNTGVVSKTPARSADDYYCLKYAINHNGYLLTNDQYNDWKKKYPELKEEIENRRVTAVWDEMTNSYIIGEFPKVPSLKKEEKVDKKLEKEVNEERKKGKKNKGKLRERKTIVHTQKSSQNSEITQTKIQKFRCEDCNRDFNTQRSLDQHNQSRHKNK